MVKATSAQLAQIGRLATPTAEKLGLGSTEGKVKDFFREVGSECRHHLNSYGTITHAKPGVQLYLCPETYLNVFYHPAVLQAAALDGEELQAGRGLLRGGAPKKCGAALQAACTCHRSAGACTPSCNTTVDLWSVYGIYTVPAYNASLSTASVRERPASHWIMPASRLWTF